MKNLVAISTVSLLLASSAAFAQSATESTGVNSALGVAPKTSDFVTEAAASDMFEIQSSKLASERSDGDTKKFAEQMIQDHQKTTDELKAMVDGGKVDATLPTSMTDAQQSTLNDLKDMQGEDFTKQYHSDQVDAHEDAVDLFKRYSEEGDNAALKAWAAKTLPTLQEHLSMAENLDK